MLNFSKYQGAGNDFVLVDARREPFDPTRERVAALCDRHKGIGADGLMMLETDEGTQFRMRYFNADGGESTMCGNGGRCIALFAHHLGIGGLHKVFRGVDGRHTADLLSLDEDGAGGVVALGMVDVQRVERLGDTYFLNTGSPHYVEFVDDLDGLDVKTLGARIRHDGRFAAGGGTNVNFVQWVADGHIRVRTFERGVEDETLACGTGATASVLASALHSGSGLSEFRVEVPGGNLSVRFKAREKGVFTDIVLTGPARRVFEGKIDVNFL